MCVCECECVPPRGWSGLACFPLQTDSPEARQALAAAQLFPRLQQRNSSTERPRRRLAPECDRGRRHRTASAQQMRGATDTTACGVPGAEEGARDGYVCRCRQTERDAGREVGRRVSDGLLFIQCFSRHCSTNKLQAPLKVLQRKMSSRLDLRVLSPEKRRIRFLAGHSLATAAE